MKPCALFLEWRTVSLVGALAAFAACNAASGTPNRATATGRGRGAGVSVQTTAVQSIAIQRQIALSGTLQSLDQAKVSSEVAGRVDKVSVELGTNVRAGDVLVRLGRHQIKSGEGIRTYKITLSRVADQNDEPAGVVAVLHDMTKEKEVAEMKNDFVSSVSHELRTPLASIKAYIEMLIDGEAEDEKTTNEFYEVIQNEANRLSRLIDNILNISRIESGLVKVNKQPQSLMVIIKEALA